MRESKKAVAAKPFVAMGHTGRPFTPDANVYMSGGSSDAGTRPRRTASAPRERPAMPVWRPSSPPRKVRGGGGVRVLQTVLG